jgi:phage-related protein
MNYHKFFNNSLTVSALSLFLFFSLNLCGQSYEKKPGIRESGFNPADQQFQRNVRLNEINVSAIRHFRKNHPTVEQEYWEKTQQGLTVHFKDMDKMSLAYYDNQGAFLYSVKYFEESYLNNDLQKRLRREYPGFQFDILTEINNDTKTIYLVTIKNKYSMKSLLIEQGEIRVIDDLNYAGL